MTAISRVNCKVHRLPLDRYDPATYGWGCRVVECEAFIDAGYLYRLTGQAPPGGIRMKTTVKCAECGVLDVPEGRLADRFLDQHTKKTGHPGSMVSVPAATQEALLTSEL